MGSAISRGDLLRTYKKLGPSDLRVAALALGFEAPAANMTIKAPAHEVTLPPIDLPLQPDPPAEKIEYEIPYFRVTSVTPSELLPQADSDTGELELPSWWYDTPSLDMSRFVPPAIKPLDFEPLTPWPRLWPVLKKILSELAVSRKPAIKPLISTLAKGNLPKRIPKQQRRRWQATIQMLVDQPERMRLFNRDVHQLIEQLGKQHSKVGMEVFYRLEDQPYLTMQVTRPAKTLTEDPSSFLWPLPQSGSQLVIFSDLGILAGGADNPELKAWLAFGKELKRRGLAATVLIPLPTTYVTAELAQVFHCISWHRFSSLSPITPAQALGQRTQADASRLQDLIAWLSPAFYISPKLLRAVRHLVPDTHVGLEAEVWQHSDLRYTPDGLRFRQDNLEKHRQRFCALARENPALAKKVALAIYQDHGDRFITWRYEVALQLEDMMGEHLPERLQQECQRAAVHLKQMAKAIQENAKGTENIPSFLHHLYQRQNPSQHNQQEHLAAIWGLLQKYPNVDLAFPTDLKAQQQALAFAATVQEKLSQAIPHQISQQADTLQLAPHNTEIQRANLMVKPINSPQLFWQSGDETKPQNLTEALSKSLSNHKTQQFHSKNTQQTLSYFTKPAWAEFSGQDLDGLYMETVNHQGEVYRWYWHPPEFFPPNNALPGFWYSATPEHLLQTLEGEKSMGRDEYGLYREIAINGVGQRFRWIEPGQFLMGSPDDEPERSSNEVQHTVTLTQGYWLADTACSQRLWQKVMGENPSEFKAKDNPVENISWQDVQAFISRAKKSHPELNLRLPTEAEWEYACRAGTQTPFFWGENITPEQVNYDGEYPYADGEKGLNRGKTCGVKALPANHWGLYQMHGNVWEWCADWYGDYPQHGVKDPQGPESGGYRVLRGGSWIRYGRDCRSGCRGHGHPEFRSASYGFRLALGHQAEPSRRLGDFGPAPSLGSGAPGDSSNDSE